MLVVGMHSRLQPGPWVVWGCSYSGALSAWFRCVVAPFGTLASVQLNQHVWWCFPCAQGQVPQSGGGQCGAERPRLRLAQLHPVLQRLLHRCLYVFFLFVLLRSFPCPPPADMVPFLVFKLRSAWRPSSARPPCSWPSSPPPRAERSSPYGTSEWHGVTRTRRTTRADHNNFVV